MPTNTQQQVLRPENLTNAINEIQTDIKINLPLGFFTESVRMVGDVGSYLKYTGSRKTAKLVNYGSPSLSRGKEGVKRRPVQLAHTFQNTDVNLIDSQGLMGPNGVVENIAVSEISRQLMDFKVQNVNLRKQAIASALVHFAVYFADDGDGYRLLPNSTGADLTVDFDVPAGQKGQLDILGGGDIIDASWATASTDILFHLSEVRRQMILLGGWEPKTILHGKNIPKYLRDNTALNQFFIRNPVFNNAVLSDDAPPGLSSYNWIDMSTGFIENGAGTAEVIIGDDEIVFLPDFGNEWYNLYIGSYVKPVNLGNVSQDLMQALTNFSQVFGMFAYATQNNDPSGLRMYAGDTFLPVINAPKAVCRADVTP